MVYKIKGGLPLSFRESVLIFLSAPLILAYGIGIVFIALIILRHNRLEIIIDTDKDILSTPYWNIQLSEIEDVHGEEIWTHNAKTGSSRLTHITLVGDFGSKRISFASKDKAHEFLNRLKKSQSAA